MTSDALRSSSRSELFLRDLTGLCFVDLGGLYSVLQLLHRGEVVHEGVGVDVVPEVPAEVG